MNKIIDFIKKSNRFKHLKVLAEGSEKQIQDEPIQILPRDSLDRQAVLYILYGELTKLKFITIVLIGVVVSYSEYVNFNVSQSDEELNSNISSSELLMNLERSFLPVTRPNAALDPELYVYPDYYCGNFMKGDKVVILVKGDEIGSYRDDLVNRSLVSTKHQWTS